MSRKVAIATCMVVIVCVVVASITAYEYWWNWSPKAKSKSVRIGNEIVKALRKYHSDHGRFPDSLEGLVPTYLPEIRNPTAGTRRWDYFLESDKQVFTLQFSTPYGYPSMNYCSFRQDAEWYEDD